MVAVSRLAGAELELAGHAQGCADFTELGRGSLIRRVKYQH